MTLKHTILSTINNCATGSKHMKLFGSFTSPYVRHCRITLLEANIPFEFSEADNATSATQSPTKRVPFLKDGDVFLTDSSSIIRYVREKSNHSFLATVTELEQFCLVNTALETTLNLFFLERDGVDIQAYDYLKRQAARIHSTVAELDELELPQQAPYNDVHLRLGCYMGWAIFRNRVDFSAYKNLQTFYASIQQQDLFKMTALPA